MTEAGWTVCIECGMMCEAVEYHPYAACLMFKQCLNSETVRANLQAVRDDSYHQGRVAGLKCVRRKITDFRECAFTDCEEDLDDLTKWLDFQLKQQTQGGVLSD